MKTNKKSVTGETEDFQSILDSVDEHIKNATDEYNKKNKNARAVEEAHLNPEFKKKKPV